MVCCALDIGFEVTSRNMTAKQVQAIRRKLGLTQQQLADRLGVSRVTVARWELGLMNMRETAARLLRTLQPTTAKRGKS
jgi:DNA-binding transcriptional regulator YiaG